MNCPGCGNAMHRIAYEGIDIESCAKCKGDWLDHDELGKVTKIREERFDAHTQRAVAQAASLQGIPAGERERRLLCPRCNEVLEPINYGGGSGIIVNRCPECRGFWLDDNELEHVQMVVEGWDDALPEDLAQHAERLHDVALGTKAFDITDEIRESRLPGIGRFINACVNGIIKIF